MSLSGQHKLTGSQEKQTNRFKGSRKEYKWSGIGEGVLYTKCLGMSSCSEWGTIIIREYFGKTSLLMTHRTQGKLVKSVQNAV